MDLNEIRKKFRDYFDPGGEDEHIFFAPGRLCLIGEHIDYNGGSVLPAALSLGIYAIFKPNNSQQVRIRSGLDGREVLATIGGEICFKEENGWGNYPLGVVKYLQDHGMTISGGDLYFDSNLPCAAGLSSSAAIEVLTAYMFTAMNGKSLLSNEEIALMCRQVENEFVGVQCGIMDQFAVAMGKKNNALMLNCSTLDHEFIPINLIDYELIIFNTNKSRELTDGQLNQRAQECREAFEAIEKHKEIESLVDAQLNDAEQFIQDPILRRRAKHVITENKRVTAAADALRQDNIEAFGDLLFKTHASLRHNYEVTGSELDAIEEAARSHPAVVGAKMSGAGFGGCAFALVGGDKVEEVIEHVLEEYFNKTGLSADYYIAEIEDGVRRISK